jgi:transcriptional regulator with XRE-family HTH domain
LSYDKWIWQFQEPDRFKVYWLAAIPNFFPGNQTNMDQSIENLGKRIKQIRITKGLTQESLATRAGLTKSYISLLETGKKIPAIFTLSHIAGALGISVGDFFQDADDASGIAVVRKNERVQIAGNGSPFGYIYEALSIKKRDRIMDPFIVKILPLKDFKTKRIEFEHAGEEFDFVIEGCAKYIVDGQEYILNEGDSIYFDSTLKHSVVAIGDKPALTLSVHASRRQ